MITPRPIKRPILGLSAVALLLCLLSGVAAAATLELTGPAGAMVSLNGRALGAFPLDGPLDLPPGSYTITCHASGYVGYEGTARLLSIQDWQRLVVRLIPLSRRTALGSNVLLAGLGQHYLGHPFRGYVYNAFEIGGLLTALAGELQRSNLQSDYYQIVALYNASINAEDIATLSQTAQAKFNDMKDMESLRDTGLLVAGAAIAVSIVDALLTFPHLEAGGGAVPVETGQRETPWHDNHPDHALHASLQLKF